MLVANPLQIRRASDRPRRLVGHVQAQVPHFVRSRLRRFDGRHVLAPPVLVYRPRYRFEPHRDFPQVQSHEHPLGVRQVADDLLDRFRELAAPAWEWRGSGRPPPVAGSASGRSLQCGTDRASAPRTVVFKLANALTHLGVCPATYNRNSHFSFAGRVVVLHLVIEVLSLATTISRTPARFFAAIGLPALGHRGFVGFRLGAALSVPGSRRVSVPARQAVNLGLQGGHLRFERPCARPPSAPACAGTPARGASSSARSLASWASRAEPVSAPPGPRYTSRTSKPWSVKRYSRTWLECAMPRLLMRYRPRFRSPLDSMSRRESRCRSATKCPPRSGRACGRRAVSVVIQVVIPRDFR